MGMEKHDRKNITKWRGIRNSDTGEIDGGYLYFQLEDEEDTQVGIRIHNVKNRSEAIKKYYSD